MLTKLFCYETLDLRLLYRSRNRVHVFRLTLVSQIDKGQKK